jgi:long-chain acyl-CoA synthetase
VLAEQACHMQAVTIVTLYDSYGPDTAKYILNQADIPTVICSESKTSDTLKCTEYCLNLKNIIQFEGVTDKLKEEGLKVGVRIFSLDEVIEAGKENIREHVKPKLQDVTTFC